MSHLSIDVAPLAFDQVDQPWLIGMKPYPYQQLVYRRTQEALSGKQTLCLFLVTPTGSGKTLASYAYAINNRIPLFGVYPTNELIRDQERALKAWIDPEGDCALLRIDSQALDRWQTEFDFARHAPVLERLLRWEPTVLTNPDILFYTFFGLYGHGLPGFVQRVNALVGSYRLFVFDEFHLYNVKQMADVAFLAATLNAINPDIGRVFLFASATPESPVIPWLQEKLGLPVEVVTGEASQNPSACMIAQPLRLTLLPADLQNWQGVQALLGFMPEIEQFLQEYPQARLVTILDAVAGAIALTHALRERFPDRQIGEIHGFTSEQEREKALQLPLTIGTSTIEVGIDFKDAAAKDLLVFEARTASQFIQRFGRIARHAKPQPTPNWAIAIVPEYVYHYLNGKLTSNRPVTRHELADHINEAYQRPENFAHYLQRHAAVEYTAARRHIESMFQADVRPRITTNLNTIIQSLTGQNARLAWGQFRSYEQEKILAPLLTFRGAGFEAAILDERGTDPGFPVKRYDLFFLLRRGVFEEMAEAEYRQELERLAARWPQQVVQEKRYVNLITRDSQDLLGVYGYFRLKGLLDKARRVWFEIGEDELVGRKAQVTVVSELQIGFEPEMHLRRLNRFLPSKQVVAWFVDRNPTGIRLGRALPPLFEIFELRVRRRGGGLSSQTWSIAFNQNAFFVDSLGWWREKRDDAAIIF